MRLPGQSGIETRNRRLARDVMCATATIGLIGIILGIILGLSLQRFLPIASEGTYWLIVAISTILMCVSNVWLYRILRRSEAQDHNDILGIKGERIVAEVLDELEREGYHVFHDVPPEREARPGERSANYDHVVIGRTGVYVIETKTRSKRVGKNEVRVSPAGVVRVNGRVADRCPIKQARTLASAMQATLRADTGMMGVPVRPVVLYPGWFVESCEYHDTSPDVWVLNPKALVKWIRSPKEVVQLTPQQVERISSCIAERCRTKPQD